MVSPWVSPGTGVADLEGLRRVRLDSLTLGRIARIGVVMIAVLNKRNIAYFPLHKRNIAHFT